METFFDSWSACQHCATIHCTSFKTRLDEICPLAGDSGCHTYFRKQGGKRTKSCFRNNHGGERNWLSIRKIQISSWEELKMSTTYRKRGGNAGKKVQQMRKWFKKCMRKNRKSLTVSPTERKQYIIYVFCISQSFRIVHLLQRGERESCFRRHSFKRRKRLRENLRRGVEKWVLSTWHDWRFNATLR